MFKNVLRLIQDRFGYPASLSAFLAKTPTLGFSLAGTRSVDASTITYWHEWQPAGWSGQQGQLYGWGRTQDTYQGFSIEVPELITLCHHERIEAWECDIRQVEVLSNSKSSLSDFSHLDDFALRCCNGYLDQASAEQIMLNLAHSEVRIMQPDRGDFFTLYGWDGRVCLMNSGGSHHFATARYLAGECLQPVPLSGLMHIYTLNPVAIFALTQRFSLFSISSDNLIWYPLVESLRAMKATWLLGELPRPHSGGKVLLLPRDESRAVGAARALHAAGIPDLGQHLRDLLKLQEGGISSQLL